MFLIRIVIEIKTQILRSTTFSFEERALYVIMWRNIVKLGRTQKTLWRMRIAYWITKATDANSQYVILICFSTTTIVTRTCLNVTFTRIFLVLSEIFFFIIFLVLCRLMAQAQLRSLQFMQRLFLYFAPQTRLIFIYL
jgi:hypothetical protein